MFYRRQRELLYVLSQLGRATSVRLQALEFLAALDSGLYEFIPQDYGPYSLALADDLLHLQKSGYIQYVTPLYSIVNPDLPQLEAKMQAELDQLLSRYGRFSSRALLLLIHKKHPSYATRSTIAPNLLKPNELQIIQELIPRADTKRLFTIGYQGRSLENYLRCLYEQSIKLLVDIRFNSHSMKIEFSGAHLQKAAALLDIEYLHIPSLGISHEYRNRFKDKEELFTFYQKEILPQKSQEISQVFKLLDKHKRIALTCYEAEPKDCHRYYLSQAMSKQSPLDVMHL